MLVLYIESGKRYVPDNMLINKNVFLCYSINKVILKRKLKQKIMEPDIIYIYSIDLYTDRCTALRQEYYL